MNSTVTDKQYISADLKVSIMIDRDSWETETDEPFTTEGLINEVAGKLSGVVNIVLPDAEVSVKRSQ